MALGKYFMVNLKKQGINNDLKVYTYCI